ncbi:MAG: hypothetical protein U5K72_18400 [Balneolaceae bacterium]|nr:hypothetical protein [Balneolaceae bacterium]
MESVKWHTDFYGTHDNAKSKAALYDSWTPNNLNASLPIQEVSDNFSRTGVPNSYVEDGSYLRLKQITIGYTLPTNALQKIRISNMRVYAQGLNLFTLTGYSGLDPEIGGRAPSYGM